MNAKFNGSKLIREVTIKCGWFTETHRCCEVCAGFFIIECDSEGKEDTDYMRMMRELSGGRGNLNVCSACDKKIDIKTIGWKALTEGN